MCIGVSTPRQKHHPPLFRQAPLKPANFSSSQFLGNSPLYTGFLCSPTRPHLLKVTKFLAEISQFKFLVMTDKKINFQVYKHFLSLNISYFSLFFI